MYAGPILKTNSAANTSITAHTMKPVKVKPFCLRMIFPSVDRSANPFEFVEIPPNEKRLPDDVFSRHETPVAAVAAAVAVISHQKVMSLRHGAGESGVIVSAIIAKRKQAHAAQLQARCFGLDQDRVPVIAEFLVEAPRGHEVQARLHVIILAGR